jgi:hypothetical protein
MKYDMKIVGRMVYVHLHKGHYVDIPAKIDTGADSSSIDTSYTKINDRGNLEYVLFQPNAPYYDGFIHETKNFHVTVVKSSTGHIQVRYTVVIPLYIADRKTRSTFTLTNRSTNTFPNY